MYLQFYPCKKVVDFQERERLETMLIQRRTLLQRPDVVVKTSKTAIYVACSFCRLNQQQKEEFKKFLNFPRISLHSRVCLCLSFYRKDI